MGTVLRFQRREHEAKLALPGERDESVFGYAEFAVGLVCGMLFMGLLARWGG